MVGKSYNIQYKKLGSVGNLRIGYIHTGNTQNTIISPGAVPGRRALPEPPVIPGMRRWLQTLMVSM